MLLRFENRPFCYMLEIGPLCNVEIWVILWCIHLLVLVFITFNRLNILPLGFATRMVGGGSDGNYQPIVPIANRLSRENSLKRQQQQNKASPITVSPVHTVKDDLKYTNYTCKPVNVSPKSQLNSVFQ